MIEGTLEVPPVENAAVLGYAPSSAERAALEATLRDLTARAVEVTPHIGGRDVPTGDTRPMRAPHRHAQTLGVWHAGGVDHVHAAIDAAAKAKPAWEAMPFKERAAIFLRAAELLATRWRPVLNAATMLGQSKTAHQAEIDAACELIDFWRYNVAFARASTPSSPVSPAGVWNLSTTAPSRASCSRCRRSTSPPSRPTSPPRPPCMGNTVVWKPAVNATYSAWFILELLREAGLPDGVVNLVSG
jgi:1-pyrroline-5-carboxylate dehydrogenase